MFGSKLNSVVLRVNRYKIVHAEAPTSAEALISAIGTNGSIRDPETGIERVGTDPISRGRYEFVPDHRRSTSAPPIWCIRVTLWMGSSVYLPMRSASKVSDIKERIRSIDGIKPGSYVMHCGSEELSDDTYIAPNSDGAPVELYILPKI